MASSKEYLEFVLGQLCELDDIAYKAMMGEFILYYKGKIVGGIYDDRLLVKPVKSAIAYMPNAVYELPYEGAKEMLLVDDVDDREYLTGLFDAMYDELPAPKPKKKNGFTLVEIIAVLVILAIFAAALIPSFSGYINKAKQREYMLKAHSAIEAAQCVIAEEYAKGVSFDSWRGFSNITDKNTEVRDKIYELSGIDKNEFVIANVDVNAKGQLIFINFYSKKTIDGQANRLVYMNGKIGGKTYDREYILLCWNGVVYHEYRLLDPASVGYKKE